MMKRSLIVCLIAVYLLTSIFLPTCDTFADEMIEATSEPIVDSSSSSTEDPITDVPEVTEEPTAEPTAEPSPDASPEIIPDETEVPSVEPTAITPVAKLSISAKVNAAYAFANEDTISARVTIDGGEAPYCVVLKLNGSEVQTMSGIAEAGYCTISYAPTQYGVHKFEVIVSDAMGASKSRSFEVPVAVRKVDSESDWKKDFRSVELTGDWREDLLAIASTQVGYKENRRNFIIDNEGKKQCYTRYGDWYGSSYADWCAMFVSFCLNYAGISENDFPYEANCAKWKKLLQWKGAYQDDEHEYEPKPGDLIFINSQSDYEKTHKLENKPLHVGIVEKVTENKVYTIEGNRDAAVCRQEYERSSNVIVGYCDTAMLMDRAGKLQTVEIEWGSANAIAYTRNAGTNLRSDATVSSDVVVKVEEADSMMTILGAKMTGDMIWYQVQYGEHTGYVRGNLVEVQGILTPVDLNATTESTTEP